MSVDVNIELPPDLAILSAMLCSRTGSLSGQHLVREIMRGPLLPFLYQTNTILRRSYAVDAIEEAQAIVQKKSRRSPDDRRPLKRRTQGADGRSNTRSRSGGDARQPRGPRYEEGVSRAETRMDHVPFEGVTGSLNPLQKLEGSTMTPREMEVFKRLLSKTAEAQTMDIGQVVKREDSSGRASGRVRADPEFPEPLRPLVDEAKALRALSIIEASSKQQEQRGSVGAQLSTRAKDYLGQTRKLMDSASNEAVLWDVLQTRVFRKVESLQLESHHQPGNAMIKDLNILTATLPSLLLHFMTIIETSFPRSSLGVMLLPALKKRGPSAFALGATTGLFNYHMDFLYKQYFDLDAVAETLADMDKNVYNFNWDTRALLTSIFDAAKSAGSGQAGPALQALWATDRRQRALKKLREWDKVVVERLNADALRRANEKEVPDEDGEESEDVSAQSI